ncbi:hypothetical protein XA68_16465 [Ophiocordyceps unilateralis]|uniref:FHA domain-containing protein n=1 Tax=Ophiocordyceps unilateralis TaxID=268505 RepID=A0A2A9P6H5_OPHUN|nr:hypothetical protein XA68_16465 [Ophiocordyceps unilateralis]
MWLLENDEIFQGRRLWLRPGSTYLFGRTAAEPGQLAVSHSTISRKHLTITVAPVGEGQSQQVSTRSKLTLEDLATKTGTEVDGHKIKGSKYVVNESKVEILMGKCPSKFQIEWFPVVLTFSFTSKELQTQPLRSLRERFESLDIKLLTDYVPESTTHVVSKKRNTAKGLQALIYGNRRGCGAQLHLPPRGGEPVQHPDDIYAPDLGRGDVFDGYTFIFYDKTQYNNLLAPITNGCGKAMLRTMTPGEESAEDFVRYVKGVAGEKGLGSFDDGSEGKGVVLVRYLPAKGGMVGWYTEFITAVSLRLDHRPIEQNEFLEAILTKDASKLRRPLEVENSPPEPSATMPAADSSTRVRGVEAEPGPSTSGEQRARRRQASDEPEPAAAPRRGANRRPVKRRFAGFDDDVDLDMDEPSTANAAKQAPQPEPEEEGGLFVSQEPDISQTMQATESTRPGRKRRASPLAEDNLMDGMAPAVARFKRQRLQQGNVFASPSPSPAAPSVVEAPSKTQSQEMDVLALAGRHREEEEARARAEREDLAQLPEGIDLAEIRRLNIVEEMEIRPRGRTAARTREQDIADGRWNPRWNGVKNFKKFRPRGEALGRQAARVIVPLTQVKDKEFGVGDNYWLEDESNNNNNNNVVATVRTKPTTQQQQQKQQQPESDSGRDAVESDSSDSDSVRPNTRSQAGARKPSLSQTTTTTTTATRGKPTPSRTMTTRGKPTASQTTTRSKRSAPSEAGPAPSSKRRRRPEAQSDHVEVAGSDDSDDELKFRFGRRR